MRTLLNFCIISAFLARSAFGAIGPATDLVISNAVVNPDGFSRAATVANGVIDRTIIKANVGDRFEINVINNMNDPTMFQTTSIHWHGILQKGTNWADGPAFINQCPVSKGHSFLYSFDASKSGTYWFHGHLSTQYCDGLRGALIVYDPNDPHLPLYDVDDDSTVLSLSDWYHDVSKKEVADHNGLPTPDSALVNGLGRTAANPNAPLAVVSVQPGKRYRFRLINMACFPNYIFSVDGHKLTIIEVDGVNHEPLVVDSIQIFVAQRYSFILEANQTVDNYWIRAKPNLGDSSVDKGINSAILRYVGAPEVEPNTPQTKSVLPLFEQDLHPLEDVAAPGLPFPGGVDQAFVFKVAFNGGKFSINGVTFESPSVPALLQILSGAQSAADLLPKGSVYGLNRGSVVEVSIPGGISQAPHPFHLHGHTFHVIRSAGSNVNNYINPPQRDVVNTGGSGSDNVTIRFVVDNPGPWFMHCHIDWHLDLGLAIYFAEDVPATAAANPVPPAWEDLCPTFNSQAPGDL